ncbi:MAG TPA: hypothetical protein VL200_07905 [Lacunisphaera sp.]|jgi:hypothetical protein|nr:hypothetical protein [Lacunisphaera sp.]
MEATALSIIAKAAVVHTVTYFIVGSLSYTLFNYPRLFAETALRHIMRPTTDPLVRLGLLFQPLRGAIFGLAFVILRPTFFADHGWLTMWSLLILLSILSSFGPTTTSIEGIIFTKLPLRLHLVGLPEILIQSFLLCFVLNYWLRNPASPWLAPLMWTLFALALIAALGSFLTKRKPNQPPEAPVMPITPPAKQERRQP